jgi:allantoicase
MSVPKFCELAETACESSGGEILFATDDFFAPAEGLLSDSEPAFIADKYTHCGQWMDGWETRRKRTAGHDWCVIKLGAPTVIRGFLVDTAYFTGNYAPRFSVQGALLSDDAQWPYRLRCCLGGACSEAELDLVNKINTEKWSTLVPMTNLKPGYEATMRQYFEIKNEQSFNHLRLNIFPDGGIARLRVFGHIRPNIETLSASNTTIDLMSMLNGCECVSYSNAHFGHPKNLIKPKRGVNMGDGWETARRLDRPAVLTTDGQGRLNVPGCEWAVFKLYATGKIEKILVI